MDNWETAARLTLSDNGGTFNGAGEVIFHGRGYYVGGLTAPSRMQVYRNGVLADVLYSFARQNEWRMGEGIYLGTWITRGVLYVDLVTWVPDEATARGLCVERGELAYFDCAKGREVYI